MLPASTMCLVDSMSFRDGVGSPEGWLWARMIFAAPLMMALRKISRGCVCLSPVKKPHCDLRKALDASLGIQPDTQHDFLLCGVQVQGIEELGYHCGCEQFGWLFPQFTGAYPVQFIFVEGPAVVRGLLLFLSQTPQAFLTD
jgi:hypothetical protein